MNRENTSHLYKMSNDLYYNTYCKITDLHLYAEMLLTILAYQSPFAVVKCSRSCNAVDSAAIYEMPHVI